MTNDEPLKEEEKDDDVQTTPIKTVEQERDEYLAGWKRALADYENLKKDLMKERQMIRVSITSEMASAFIPLYDHLLSATSTAPNIPEAKKWFEGVGLIAGQFKEILAEFGVMPINTMDAQFDPHLHEAVGSEWDETKNENIIIKETQIGYMLKDKLLRPSKVIINSKNN